MEINERIAKIKEYFVTFRIQDGGIYVYVRTPEGWTSPDVDILKGNYKVVMGPTEDKSLVIFATELDNGINCVFDAIEYAIQFNHEAKERKGLLDARVKELTELFKTEDLERLRNLQFTFPPKKGGRKHGNAATKAKTKITSGEGSEECLPERGSKTPQEAASLQPDNSLMSFAKRLVD